MLRGSTALLRAERPRLIMFESLEGRLDSVIADILAGANYRVFELNAAGRPDFVHHSAQNLFAVPDELSGST